MVASRAFFSSKMAAAASSIAYIWAAIAVASLAAVFASIFAYSAPAAAVAAIPAYVVA